MSSPLALAGLAAGTAILFASTGIRLMRAGSGFRALVPVSGGLLLGVALFGLIPEVASEIGWLRSTVLVATGYALLTALDRFAFSVCPACSHDHDHENCSKTLHGFAVPLVIASSVHAFVDGWGLGTVQLADPHLAASVTLAILLHKVPEGLALGTMLRAATGRPWIAFCWSVAAESPTLLGGMAAAWATPLTWLSYVLAAAGGSFLFLGFHAIHGEWRKGGAGKAAIPALAGGAGAALIQLGVRAWVR